jgi:4-amino-4-deoxychorismate lyase
MGYLIYNGFIMEEDEFVLPVNNRALSYGDGLFETIIYHNQKVRFIAEHVERITEGLKALQIEVPSKISAGQLEQDIMMLAGRNNFPTEARVKLLVWRKTGGLFEPESNQAEYLLFTKPYRRPTEMKAEVYFCKNIKIQPHPWSQYKSLNALPYVMAGVEKKTRGADDMIICNQNNHIAECLYSNVWWIDNNILYTPSLDAGCINGIMRRQIMELCKKNKIAVEEGLYTREELMKADTVFTSNVNGLALIRRVDEHGFGQPHYLYTELKTKTDELLQHQ